VAAQVLKNPIAILLMILTIPAYCYVVFKNLSSDLIETALVVMMLFSLFQILSLVYLVCMCDKFYTDFKTISVMPIKKEKAVKIYIAGIAVFTSVPNIVYAIFETVIFSKGSIDLMQFTALIMFLIGCIAVTVTMLCLYTVNFCVYSGKNHSSKKAFNIKISLFYLFLIALVGIRAVIEMTVVFYGIKTEKVIAATIFALTAVVVSVIVGNRTAKEFYL
jgi:hypothetical protein